MGGGGVRTGVGATGVWATGTAAGTGIEETETFLAGNTFSAFAGATAFGEPPALAASASSASCLTNSAIDGLRGDRVRGETGEAATGGHTGFVIATSGTCTLGETGPPLAGGGGAARPRFGIGPTTEIIK